jgi:hypothetical protein
MTYEEQIKIEFTLNEKIANVILIFLLLVRLVDHELAVWIFGANVPDRVAYWYNSIAFILTATIVWLNRHRLATLNIDRPFIAALILGGAFYAFRRTPDNVGALVGITAGLIYWAYIHHQFIFKNPVPYPMGTGLLILLSMLLAVAPVLLFPSTLKTPLSLQIFITTFLGALQSYLMLNIFEEVIFRGALWAYLRSLGLNEPAAFSAQAFLFWIAHHRTLLLGQQYFFWVAAPCMAILLGLLAWRSKSLTPSTIGHFLFNFIGQLLLKIY